jgi:UDPglucose 6-dehydrogenase
MKIAIFGSGYVGLVTGVCFAEMGNHVTAVDISTERVALLNAGECPIYEPGLQSLIQKNLASGHLKFTTDSEAAITNSAVIFVGVGTPAAADGTVNLEAVESVARSIGQYLNEYRIIVNKSTVPVGTAARVEQIIQAELMGRGKQVDFDVVSNPEFLKEGAAIQDFMKPDRIIIGVESKRALDIISELYVPFNRNHDRLIVMDVRSAELTKYVANAMLATKISFMNEMSQIAEKVGADIEKVRLGIGADQRIGYHFIYPGCGYGGSCFPKDVQGLLGTAKDVGCDLALLRAVHQVNEAQKNVLFSKISQYFNGDLEGRVFGLWGLSFKPNTDDIRDAPSRVLMEALFSAGAFVKAYDPEAMENIAKAYPKHAKLVLCPQKESALADADALVILTEWPEFRSPDFDLIKSALKSPLIFDGRNLFDPARLKQRGFAYYCIGRPC